MTRLVIIFCTLFCLWSSIVLAEDANLPKPEPEKVPTIQELDGRIQQLEAEIYRLQGFKAALEMIEKHKQIQPEASPDKNKKKQLIITTRRLDLCGVAATLKVSGLEVGVGRLQYIGIAAADFVDGGKVSVVHSGAARGIASMTFNPIYLVTEARDAISAINVPVTYSGYIIVKDLSTDTRMALGGLIALTI